MNADDVRKIMSEVKANMAKLDACGGPHEFEPNRRIGQLVMDERCRKCEGVTDAINAEWYRRGLKHGQQI